MSDQQSIPATEPTIVVAASEQQDGTVSLLDLLQLVVENLRLLVLVPLVVGLFSFAFTFTVKPTFTATVRGIAPQKESSLANSVIGGLGGFTAGLGSARNSIEQTVSLTKSDSVQYALIDRFKLAERYEQKSKEDTRNVLDGRVRVSGNAKDGLITLEADDYDPVFAAELANGYVEELNRLLQQVTLTEAERRRVFYEKQMLLAKSNLVKAELALKTSSVGSDALKTNPATAVDEVARIKAAITAQELKLATMRGYLSTSAPDYKQTQIELAAMRAQLSRAEDRQPADASSGDYVTKYREFKYQESLVELFTKQYEAARVDGNYGSSVVQVVDPAIPPERKSKPRRAIIALITTLLSGVAMLSFVVARNTFRNAKKDTQFALKLSNLRKASAKAFGRP